jgi:hypothetical protein
VRKLRIKDQKFDQKRYYVPVKSDTHKDNGLSAFAKTNLAIENIVLRRKTGTRRPAIAKTAPVRSPYTVHLRKIIYYLEFVNRTLDSSPDLLTRRTYRYVVFRVLVPLLNRIRFFAERHRAYVITTILGVVSAYLTVPDYSERIQLERENIEQFFEELTPAIAKSIPRRMILKIEELTYR